MNRNKLRIDLKDLWRLRRYRWGFSGKPGNDYLTRQDYSKGKGGKTSIKLHREIIGAKKGEFVDHIDGDRMNNSRSNLRICTQQQNNCNARRTKGLSRWKGVYRVFNTTDKVWAAHISATKKRTFLGCFADAACAATAYNFAAAELHGEFAVFNTVPQPWLECEC